MLDNQHKLVFMLLTIQRKRVGNTQWPESLVKRSKGTVFLQASIDFHKVYFKEKL